MGGTDVNIPPEKTLLELGWSTPLLNRCSCQVTPNSGSFQTTEGPINKFWPPIELFDCNGNSTTGLRTELFSFLFRQVQNSGVGIKAFGFWGLFYRAMWQRGFICGTWDRLFDPTQSPRTPYSLGDFASAEKTGSIGQTGSQSTSRRLNSFTQVRCFTGRSVFWGVHWEILNTSGEPPRAPHLHQRYCPTTGQSTTELYRLPVKTGKVWFTVTCVRQRGVKCFHLCCHKPTHSHDPVCWTMFSLLVCWPVVYGLGQKNRF